MQTLSYTIKKLIKLEDAAQSFCCMTEVGSPWPDALCLCRDWIASNLGKYVEGFHIVLEDGVTAGHLYYGLLPRAVFAYRTKPEGAAVLYCEWVQRRFQGQGLGKQLFDAFLEEMKKQKVPGVLVEATDNEGQMYYQDYLSRGFQLILDRGQRRLLYLPNKEPSVEVQALEPRLRPRSGMPVEIVVLFGYLCPYDASTYLSIRDIAREFGDQVVLREIWITPENVPEYGETRGIFINGRKKLWGGETEGAIRQAIAEEISHGR
jgi:GNAT superfamily N-acetyltransferase